MTESYAMVGKVKFPFFTGVNVNMMPFVMGDINSIPPELRQYEEMIRACRLPKTELGKVGYLSVSESEVLTGQTQRRPGLHVEGHPQHAGSPGTDPWDSGGGWGGGWGAGQPLPTPKRKRKPAQRAAGLYMASNVDRSCRIWNQFVAHPGPMGDCEHLRAEMGEGVDMMSGELYWLTDRTPHEALPAITRSKRQWFRLVSSAVDIWYRQHSTPNPLGVEPACRILENNKFS